MPEAEAGGAAAWLGGELILAGGTKWAGGKKRFLRSTQIYEPGADRWRTGPNLTFEMAYGPFVSSAGGLEVFGGIGSEGVHRESWVLSAGSKAWKRSGTVPADVLLGGAAAAGGSVYLLGGCPDAADLTRCSDIVWKRSDSGEWQEVSRLPQGPLALHAVAASRSQIYVFGGCSMAEGQVRNHAEAWTFDIGTSKWTRLPPLPEAARGVVGVMPDSTQVLLVGGYAAAGFTSQVLTFDTKTRTYRALRDLPVGLMGVAAVSDGKRIYVAGGEDKPRNRSPRLLRAELSR